MLRATLMTVVAVALAVTLGCIALAVTGVTDTPVLFGTWVALQLAIVLAGFVFERVRYKPLDGAAPAGFAATAERFVDPASGRAVQVWFNAATGERRYVAAPESVAG